MNTVELENGIQKLLSFYKEKQVNLNNLKIGLTQEGEERKTLDFFLSYLDLEINDQTRYIAYTRLVSMYEDNLKSYLEKSDYTRQEVLSIMKKAYGYVEKYHSSIFIDIMNYSDKNDLLSEFYSEVLRSVYTIGEAMNDFHIVWTDYIINNLNYNLEQRFDNDKIAIMAFLTDNDLLDKGHQGELADRSYSTLMLDNDNSYNRASYITAFPQEVNKVIYAIDRSIAELSTLEDEIYKKHRVYISYFKALKDALEETDCDCLVGKWAQVDIEWMNMDTPFQIAHPLEYYEDAYRKSVAVEWDLRIVDRSIMQSQVKQDMVNMYEGIFDEFSREKYNSSYTYSLSNLNRVQLYISHPVMYFGSEFCGLFSAQVVPNDDRVSEAHGKKIFAYPKRILDVQRSTPEMKINSEIFEKCFLDDLHVVIQKNDKRYFDIYDIETIGHEYGHTLWLDLGNEAVMNQTGNYKNIEEFKATTGGLVAYFKKENRLLDYHMLLLHISRCVKLMKYREVEDVTPYYCEALIHLDILFETGILSFDGKKLKVLYTSELFNSLADNYFSAYNDLIQIYLNKKDASIYLHKYTNQKGKFFLPKREYIKEFVEYYYTLYNQIGNEIL